MSPFSIANCQLPIADFRSALSTPKVFQLAIANRQSPLYFVLRSFRIIFCVRLLLRVL